VQFGRLERRRQKTSRKWKQEQTEQLMTALLVNKNPGPACVDSCCPVAGRAAAATFLTARSIGNAQTRPKHVRFDFRASKPAGKRKPLIANRQPKPREFGNCNARGFYGQVIPDNTSRWFFGKLNHTTAVP
jgi:hypothetical protein